MGAHDWYAWYKSRGGSQLRVLLMDLWDPIGVRGVPEALDEYDTYAGRIANKLRAGADVGQVTAMLSDARTDAMGLSANPAADAAAAAAVIAWYADAMRAEEAGGGS